MGWDGEIFGLMEVIRATAGGRGGSMICSFTDSGRCTSLGVLEAGMFAEEVSNPS